jgi:alpha-amylase/alpha-mannosidase (GH57 family)
MSERLSVCFLWHFHQPQYQDLTSGTALLPWTRLHCARNYTMMLRLLEEQPAAHVTINITPVLAAQLDAYARGASSDEWLDLASTPTAELDENQRVRLTTLFFDVNRERILDSDARYAELDQLRSKPASSWSEQELRDLQCKFTLAWTCPSDLPVGRVESTLAAKSRDYTDDDRAALVTAQQELVRDFLPRLGRLAASGQIELATSPFAHPILPLLIDTDIAHLVQDTPLPQPAFRHSEDAFMQLKLGKQTVEDLLRYHVQGCWPSEGSVSPNTVAEIARAGFSWTATDEEILLRELSSKPRTELYHPYRTRTVAGDVTMIFRDRELSDAIGFQYSSMTAERAMGQFMGRVRAIRDSLDGPGVLPIIMDGENAWEFYPGGGTAFLKALYAALADEPGICLTTVGDAIDHCPAMPMPDFRPGSWINGDFRVWVGEEEKNRSWEYLWMTREDWERFDPAEQERSRMSLYAAEGSDWNWWYGRDCTAETAVQFDSLYRCHLANVYRQAGRQVPDRLYVPILEHGPAVLAVVPVGLVDPHIDGGPARYLDWASAYSVGPSGGGGAMNSGAPVVSSMRVGYNLSNMYLLMQFAPQAAMSADLRVEVGLTSPGGTTRLIVRRENGEAAASIEPLGPMTSALRETLQIQLPFETLRAQRGDTVTFTVLVLGEGRLASAIPAHGVFSIELPDVDYDPQHRET